MGSDRTANFHFHFPHFHHNTHNHEVDHEDSNNSRNSTSSRRAPIPKGYVAILVGHEEEEELQRFIIPVMYMNHPLFIHLLKEAEEEYGFDHEGPITIPCHVDEFKNVQEIIDRDRQNRKLLAFLHHQHEAAVVEQEEERRRAAAVGHGSDDDGDMNGEEERNSHHHHQQQQYFLCFKG